MEFRKIFGGLFSQPRIDTVEQAKREYDKCCDAKKGTLILQKWNDLYLPVIESAAASWDVDVFLKAISSPFFPPEGKAYERAYEELNKILPKISKPEEIKVINKSFLTPAPNFDGRVSKRWKELVMPGIEKASTVEEFDALFDNVLEGSPEFELLLSKWVGTCTTTKEIEDLGNKFFKEDRYYPSVMDSIENRRAVILLTEVLQINDNATIKQYCSFIDSESAISSLAIERWLDLCRTPEEAMGALRFIISKKKKRLIPAAEKKVKELILKSQYLK